VPGGDAPGVDGEGVDDEGVREEDMWGWESPWNSDQLGSDARGPDPYYNNPPEEESDDDKGGGGNGDDYYYSDDDDSIQSSQAENMNLGPESEQRPPSTCQWYIMKICLKAHSGSGLTILAPVLWVRQR
jgi:hypothetical protein